MLFIKKLSLVMLTVIFLSGSGCGYTQHLVLPGGIQTIAVPTFRNAIPAERLFTYKSGLEIDLTNAVIRQFNFDGNLRVVSEGKADAKLVGSIISYDQEALRFTSLDRPQELRLHLVVDLKMINLKTGQEMWHEPNFSGSTLFEPNDEQGLRRITAASDAVDVLAKNIVNRTVEDW